MWLFKADRHRRWREKLSAYIDERLESPERQKLEQDLAGCDLCQEELESLRTTVALLGRMPQVPVPRSFRLAEAPRWDRGVSWTLRYALPVRYATATAAVLFLAVALGDVLLPANGVAEPIAPYKREAATQAPAPAAAPASAAPAATAAPAAREAATEDLQVPAAFSGAPEEEAPPGTQEAPEEVPSKAAEPRRSVLSRTLDWLVVAAGALFVALAILVFLQWRAARKADLKQ